MLSNLFTSCFKLLFTLSSLTLHSDIITAVRYIPIMSNPCAKYRRSAGEFLNPPASISHMKIVAWFFEISVSLLPNTKKLDLAKRPFRTFNAAIELRKVETTLLSSKNSTQCLR